MIKAKKWLLVVFVVLLLCGCQSIETNTKIPATITVGEKSFSIETINNGIKDTFNKVLYYHGYDSDSEYLTFNSKLVLDKELKYELFFDSKNNNGDNPLISTSKIYIAITNVPHPLSTEESPMLYEFGIDITELGLKSDFCYQGYSLKGEPYSFLKENSVYLGSYTMSINEIVKPTYEAMDDQWKSNAQSAIQLYMDKNDFYSDEGKNLLSGKYNVYVQGFFKSDTDSTIVFEHENGSIYIGQFNFVHDVSGNQSADLNKVELYSGSDSETFKKYLETVRLDAVIVLQYEVRD